MSELEESFNKLMESYKCGCHHKDEHGCTDCMNSGVILDNPEIWHAIKFREESKNLIAALKIVDPYISTARGLRYFKESQEYQAVKHLLEEK